MPRQLSPLLSPGLRARRNPWALELMEVSLCIPAARGALGKREKQTSVQGGDGGGWHPFFSWDLGRCGLDHIKSWMLYHWESFQLVEISAQPASEADGDCWP